MELQNLKYFCTVARLEHMRKASEELNISQPSLSISIRRLESEIGFLLFDRNGRNIKLNSSGKAFLSHVIPALEQIEVGLQEANDMKDLKKNQLTIVSPALFVFPGLMDKVIAYNPNIVIKLTNYYSPDTVAQMIINGDIDFCISNSPLTSEALMSVTLRHEEMVLIMNSSHPLAAHNTIRLSDCRFQQFAAYSSNNLQRYNFDRICASVGLIPRISFEANSLREIFGSVMGSRYIALVAKPGLDYYDCNNLAVLKATDVPQDTCMKIYWSKAKETNVAKSVRQIITEYFKNEDQVT